MIGFFKILNSMERSLPWSRRAGLVSDWKLSLVRRSALAAILLLVSLSTWRASGEDWLGFHGLERQGISHGQTQSVDWSSFQATWKTVIPGIGFSSPVVVQDRIYVTTAYETNKGAGISNVVACSAMVLAW